MDIQLSCHILHNFPKIWQQPTTPSDNSKLSHPQVLVTITSTQCRPHADLDLSKVVTLMVPSLNVKSVANASSTSECSTVIVEITHHTKNTNAHIATRDSTIRSIWRDMFELTLEWNRTNVNIVRNPSHNDAVWNLIKIKFMELNAKCHTKNVEKKSMFVKNAVFLLATFVSTTSMLEKLIATASNAIQQHIPNIINQQQVLNLSKPKQAAVEPV
jgi:hypothetical protein